MEDFRLIYDFQAERSLIGAMLIAPEKVIPEAALSLSPNCFYHGLCRQVYSACVEYFKLGKPIDPITVSAKSGGQFFGGTSLLILVGGTAKAVNHSKTSVQIRFQSFWEAYPKKKAKGDALKAFNKLNPDDGLMEKMLSALEWQKKSFDWTKDGGQYIPLPASWIRGMRWEDEPEAAVKKEGRKWKILD